MDKCNKAPSFTGGFPLIFNFIFKMQLLPIQKYFKK